MNTSHLLSNPLSNHHFNNSHNQLNNPNASYTTKMSASNHDTATVLNASQQQHAGLLGSSSLGRSNAQTSTAPTQTPPPTNVGSGLNTTNNNATQPQPPNKFAPARRLAARQTLRLAIPKQQGDSTYSTLTNNHQQAGGFSQFRHSSPSQLPPAPILKRTPVTTTPQMAPSVPSSAHSLIPKTASPLESQNLPNVSVVNNGGCTSAATPSTAGSSSQFLRVRNPSITLNSTDLCNNNDFFAFAKELSSPAVGGKLKIGVQKKKIRLKDYSLYIH